MEYRTLEEFPTYEVSREAIVRNKKTLKILSQSLSSKGYYQVNIGGKSRRVHRLVAIAFVPNPDNFETVNHKDGNKLNNSPLNLEWMSRSDNIKHAREVLGIKSIPYSVNKGQHHLKGRVGDKSLRGKPVIAEFPDGTKWYYGSAYQAALELFGDRELGKQIRQSINRNSKSYKGIKFSNHGKSKS